MVVRGLQNVLECVREQKNRTLPLEVYDVVGETDSIKYTHRYMIMDVINVGGECTGTVNEETQHR